MTERNAHGNLAAYEHRIRECLVIDETSPSGLRWNNFASPKVRGKAAGSVNGHGYWCASISVNGADKHLPVHRVVWFLSHGAWPSGELDHMNGDRLDNRLMNLRPASAGENARNRVRQANNTSGTKGVHFSKNTGKWRALLGHNGRQLHIGLFDDIADAENAVRAAREELHGEFANHGGK